jgi:hypothetical protein
MWQDPTQSTTIGIMDYLIAWTTRALSSKCIAVYRPMALACAAAHLYTPLRINMR